MPRLSKNCEINALDPIFGGEFDYQTLVPKKIRVFKKKDDQVVIEAVRPFIRQR
jgi:hypothetical protein